MGEDTRLGSEIAMQLVVAMLVVALWHFEVELLCLHEKCLN